MPIYYWWLKASDRLPLVFLSVAELGMSPDTSVQYPFCSWRYMYSQLSRDTSAWNVAFPDQNSIYHSMLVYFNKGDEVGAL